MPPHLGLKCKTVNKVFVNPLLLSALHIYCSTAEMMSVSETTYTRYCTPRYELWPREIYIKEPITSLAEQPQMQDESINAIQETTIANSGWSYR